MAYPEVVEAIREAGVFEDGHTILNGGQHTDTKLNMERLLSYDGGCSPLRTVMDPIAEIVKSSGVDGWVPAPKGALDLAMFSYRAGWPDIITADKRGPHEFTIASAAANEAVLQADRLAVFDDAVTTGWTPIRIGAAVQRVNPKVKLEFVGIWRRDTLVPYFGKMFERVTFLVEEKIPAWPAADCYCGDMA